MEHYLVKIRRVNKQVRDSMDYELDQASKQRPCIWYDGRYYGDLKDTKLKTK